MWLATQAAVGRKVGWVRKKKVRIAAAAVKDDEGCMLVEKLEHLLSSHILVKAKMATNKFKSELETEEARPSRVPVVDFGANSAIIIGRYDDILV